MRAQALHDIPIHEPTLAAFASIMVGASPFDPSPDVIELAALAAGVAAPHGSDPSTDAGIKAFRSVYTLTRGHDASAAYRADPAGATRAWKVLEATLARPRRQRAALALRFVFSVPVAQIATVLGASPRGAGEVIDAGLTAVTKALGIRVDVRRHLRSVGEMLRPAMPVEKAEPRSVVRLLLSSIAEAPAARGRAATPPEARPPRPVYGPAVAVPAPPLPETASKSRRSGALLVAAMVSLLAFLGAFVPTVVLQRPVRIPTAAVPLAPSIVRAEVHALPSPVLDSHVVREGETLWRVSGRRLGDPFRWTEIWRLNLGREMTGGERFVDPDLIRPGWVLRLPSR